ncbi:hypothetical protein NE237_029880 [Protea cynaroides]|uniref:Phytocyanin domain-containing protein n=1 Tax=Protea cynaroides TaxID=273540 RepID=A0A9Q0GUR0_9MAGN|nr:hypothetical protein NE237_029880 [Protea cynaroides]
MDGRIEPSIGSALVLLLEVVVALTALLQCAAAETTHVVGDSLGWTLTPDGPITYSKWASSHTFIVGDILVFNFTTGEHDVAKVSKASFDACDGTTTTIGSVMDTGPATITLSSIGKHYFICTFIGHCSFGQKLAIKVTAASATTNPLASPPSISSMPATPPILSIAPILSNPPTLTPPPMSAPAISEAPGPTNPPTGTASPPYVSFSPMSAPPLSEAPGPTNPPTETASPPSYSPSPTLAPTLGRVPATYVVGDSLGWTIPLNGLITYSTWATGKTFMVGDTLWFDFTTGIHDVAEVSKASFEACDGTRTIGSVINTSPARITLSTIGEHYFICSFIGHCSFGQKLAIKVIAASAPSYPPPYSPPTFISPMISMTPKASIAPIAPTPAIPITTFPPSISPMPALGPANPLKRVGSPTSFSPSPMLASMPSQAPGPAKPLAGMASPPSMDLSPILAPTLSIAPGGPAANPPARISFPPSVSPSSMLAPTLARFPETYLVGDSLGWTIPLSGPITYASWATGKTFMVGDTLVFDFQLGEHDVAEVAKPGFDACDASKTIGYIFNVSPASITLISPGEHFFICTFSAHCSFGQKLAINVTAEPPTAATPPIFPPSSSSISPSPSTHLISGASPSPATPPETLVPSPSPATPPPTLAASPSSATPPTTLAASPSPATPPTTLAASPSLTPSQPVASPASSTLPGTSPTSAASPPSTTPTLPALAPTHSRPVETYTVGGSSGWVLPPGGASVYSTWASNKTFAVGDTLLFNFATGQHDVAEVSKSSYEACSKATIIGSHIEKGPAKITLLTPGEHYFICTYPVHCQVGQKLAVNVILTTTTTAVHPSTNNSPSIAVSPSLLATAPTQHGHPSSASSLNTIVAFSITSFTIFVSFFF